MKPVNSVRPTVLAEQPILEEDIEPSSAAAATIHFQAGYRLGGVNLQKLLMDGNKENVKEFLAIYRELAIRAEKAARGTHVEGVPPREKTN